MSTENVEVFNKYQGNGVATQFSIGFPYLKREYVKVYLYRKATGEEVKLNSNQFSFVNDQTIIFPILSADDILQEGDILTIQRETTLGSEFEFDNQRRLFPVEVMNADDLSFQQIQELRREINRSIRVNPTAVETPEELLNTVYSKLDSATAIAGEAIAAADQATIAAEKATVAVEAAEKQVVAVTEYVDEKKAEIDAIVSEAEASVDDAITQATEDVKQAALDVAQDAISDAAATATSIVVDYANNEIKPLLNEIASNAAESAENASESAGLAANESGNAAISATDSQHYAEDSRIWAEGSDSEVGRLDGIHSSKVWAAQAKTSENNAKTYAESVNPDKFLNKEMITNCITEIPQDIKLELKDGVLTVKAGSKTYKPDGRYTQSNEDKSVEIKVDGKYFIYTWSFSTITSMPLEYTFSGATPPTVTRSSLWFDTTNNIIKQSSGDGSTWNGNIHLPMAVVTVSNGAISSIDQVFNGFGYIGSTVFALPGVKGLIPNGRNADGSLKNIEFEADRVLTITTESTNISNLFVGYFGRFDIQIRNPYNSVYDKDINKWYNPETGNQFEFCIFGNVSSDSSAKITSFTPKLPFRAVDYNDVEALASSAFDNKLKVVSTLPSNPDLAVFYYIPE
jgi:hypothetical protein